MRQFLGNIAFVIGQVLATILFSPVALIATRFMSSLQKAAFVGTWAAFIRWWLKICCRIDIRVNGQKHIPNTPCVVLANHQSAWETIVFQLVFPAQSYLMKKSLLWIPFFGWGLAANEPIAIDRSNKTQALSKLISQGKERLSKGRWIIIFPEGTRRPVGEAGKFQIGGAYIASKAKVPVLPVAHNAGVFWQKGNVLGKKAGTVDIVIGPAIDTRGLKVREINSAAEQWVLENLKNLPTTPA